jgi:electron transport complex protein RnfG
MRNLYVRLALPVVVVCMVAAAGLSVTYALTKDKIAATDKANEEKALKAVLPDADAFKPVPAATLGAAGKAAGDVPVLAVYAAMQGSQQIGWGVKVTPRGYGGPITMVVGLDSDGKVTGVSIVSSNETPGLGTKAVGPDEQSVAFLGSFVGVSSSDTAGDVDTITGATKSSRGVRNGVTAALKVYEDVLSKGGGAQ